MGARHKQSVLKDPQSMFELLLNQWRAPKVVVAVVDVVVVVDDVVVVVVALHDCGRRWLVAQVAMPMEKNSLQ